jgi:hypothetical protein
MPHMSQRIEPLIVAKSNRQPHSTQKFAFNSSTCSPQRIIALKDDDDDDDEVVVADVDEFEFEFEFELLASDDDDRCLFFDFLSLAPLGSRSLFLFTFSVARLPLFFLSFLFLSLAIVSTKIKNQKFSILFYELSAESATRLSYSQRLSIQM